MANWPDLQEFSFKNEVTYPNPFEIPPETPARCLALRCVRVQGFDMACVLTKIAPFVEGAYILHNETRHGGTLACLHRWSKTLVDLRLRVVEYNEEAFQDFPPLRKLRYFLCAATDVHPRFLETMESLEELYYTVRPQRAEQLVNCFKEGTRSGDFLPALKILCFRSAVLLDYPERFPGECDDEWVDRVEPSRAALRSLEEICAQRGISFSVDDCDQYRWSD
ncbi:hypothetical protein DFH11DRAFT_1637381 [Phellopilus nigrolimitatus]|nr:hypothetical protein DFH11DRAFT_1637381 [Phellopilus nigrolimitatus]